MALRLFFRAQSMARKAHREIVRVWLRCTALPIVGGKVHQISNSHDSSKALSEGETSNVNYRETLYHISTHCLIPHHEAQSVK